MCQLDKNDPRGLLDRVEHRGRVHGERDVPAHGAVGAGHVEVGGVGEEPRDDALADRVHVRRRRLGNLVSSHRPQHLYWNRKKIVKA